MDNDDLDLPGSLADALRNVPPADPGTKDAHIAAALSAWEAETDRPSRVTAIDSRRRVLLSTAAAMLLIVGAGIGWVIHSPRATPVAADVSVSSVAPATDSALTDQTTDTTLAKGYVPDEYAPQPNSATVGAASACGFWAQPDLKYVGSYSTPEHTYVLMQQGRTIVWFDKDTCAPVMTVPSPTTSAP